MPSRPPLHRLVGAVTAAAAIAITAGGCRLTDAARGVRPGGLTAAAVPADTESLLVPVRDAVATLLARHVPAAVVPVSLETPETGPPAAKRICIVPIADATNADRDALGPRIGAIIQQRIDESDAFEAIAPRFVVAGLEAARLQPADLRLPERRRAFAAFMEQQGQEIDYLLLAAIEPAGATDPPSRDRVLALTLVHAADGSSEECRKPLPAPPLHARLGLPPLWR
jgi:hypothetical protein